MGLMMRQKARISTHSPDAPHDGADGFLSQNGTLPPAEVEQLEGYPAEDPLAIAILLLACAACVALAVGVVATLLGWWR